MLIQNTVRISNRVLLQRLLHFPLFSITYLPHTPLRRKGFLNSSFLFKLEARPSLKLLRRSRLWYFLFMSSFTSFLSDLVLSSFQLKMGAEAFANFASFLRGILIRFEGEWKGRIRRISNTGGKIPYMDMTRILRRDILRACEHLTTIAGLFLICSSL